MRQQIKMNQNIGFYYPIAYPSDFWNLRKHLIPLNETTTEAVV
jgi:hypothetical protein